MKTQKDDKKLIEQAVKADVPVIQIISSERKRIHGMIAGLAQELGKAWYIWDRVNGLMQWNKPEQKWRKLEGGDWEEPALVLDAYRTGEGIEPESIVLLEDFHPDLTEDKPKNIRALRNLALDPVPGRCLVLLQPYPFLPRELEKEIQVYEFPLPSVEDLRKIRDGICGKYKLDKNIQCDRLLDAALGLSLIEAEMAFKKAAVEEESLGDSEVDFIVREKEQIIRKSGYLEYFHPQYDLNDVGGLDQLKSWLDKRGNGFYKDAKDFGLESPRGVLLLGIPGTGKSLSAKAIASTWRFPLLRLDMGKIFGGIVGQSEDNIRKSLQIAEAMSPCVLWIDEIEKGMSGMESSGSSDGGTTSRVMSTFLTWMQEKTRPVFVVATANRINSLPPELLRKGRVDEIFFVDLPAAQARQQIFEIHLKRKKRDSKKFDLEKLVQASKGFSGAEIEEAIKEAMFQAFSEAEDLNTEHIVQALGQTTPLSRTRFEEIKQMRTWAKARTILASSEPTEELGSEQAASNIPRLKQEYSDNPFL